MNDSWILLKLRNNCVVQNGTFNFVDENRALTVYVEVLREDCPPELLTETRLAACATNPWLQSSSNLSGDDAKASAIRVKQTDACSSTFKGNILMIKTLQRKYTWEIMDS